MRKNNIELIIWSN